MAAESIVSQLTTAVTHLQASRYASAAASTIYVYDIVLTFGKEVELVWKRTTFTWPTLLYFINRYVCLGFFLLTTYQLADFRPPLTVACRNGSTVAGLILAYIAWTGTLTLRVCALWQRQRALVYTISILWVVVMAIVIATACISYITTIQTMTYYPIVNICGATTLTPVAFAAPITTTVYELILTLLTVWKAWQYISGTSTFKKISLMRLLFRDGVFYFILGLIISIANTVVLYSLPKTLLQLMVYLYWALMSTCVSRLILNLRELFLVQEEDEDGITYDVPIVRGGRSRRSRFIMGNGEFEFNSRAIDRSASVLSRIGDPSARSPVINLDPVLKQSIEQEEFSDLRPIRTIEERRSSLAERDAP